MLHTVALLLIAVAAVGRVDVYVKVNYTPKAGAWTADGPKSL